jgi:hypothetical protein
VGVAHAVDLLERGEFGRPEVAPFRRGHGGDMRVVDQYVAAARQAQQQGQREKTKHHATNPWDAIKRHATTRKFTSSDCTGPAG